MTERTRLAVHDRPRLDAGRLDEPPGATPTLRQVLDAYDATDAEEVLLTGGEPTLRADLPELIAALDEAGAARIVLRTDGLALGAAGPISVLLRAGLTGVRVPFPSARADAHDWLAGGVGTARRRARAIRRCVEEGLEVEAEITLSRPTTGRLDETTEMVAHLGCARVAVRLPTLGPAPLTPELALSVAPRLSAIPAAIDSARRVAARHELGFETENVPLCFSSAAPVGPLASAGPCGACPGLPACPGVDAAYLALFGDQELQDRRRPPHGEVVEVRFEPDLPARVLRQRLVATTRGHAAVLRIEGARSLAHPEAAALLRDAARLSYARVEVISDVRPLASLSDRELRRLRGLDSVRAHTYGEDSPETAQVLDVLRRLRERAGIDARPVEPEAATA